MRRAGTGLLSRPVQGTTLVMSWLSRRPPLGEPLSSGFSTESPGTTCAAQSKVPQRGWRGGRPSLRLAAGIPGAEHMGWAIGKVAPGCGFHH